MELLRYFYDSFINLLYWFYERNTPQNQEYFELKTSDLSFRK